MPTFFFLCLLPAITANIRDGLQVGVEHLLRDINDPSVSSLAGETRHKLVSVILRFFSLLLFATLARSFSASFRLPETH